MLVRQNAVNSALLRAQRFCAENLAELTDADLTTARKRLDDVIVSFSTHGVVQKATDREVKGENAKQQQLRLTLRTDVMRPIAEIARRNLRTVPEFRALQMPQFGVTGPAFIADATGMVQAATIHKQTLIERGMPADFLDQFQAALTQLQQSVSDRDQSLARRVGATQALADLEKEGRSVLKVLDAQIRRALRDNVALLAAWENARAIRRQATTPTPAPTNQTTTSTSSAAPTSTPATPVTPSVATANS